jgi:hypothetical protein
VGWTTFKGWEWVSLFGWLAMWVIKTQTRSDYMEIFVTLLLILIFLVIAMYLDGDD